MVYHFSHPHRLELQDLKEGEVSTCRACNLPVLGLVYSCGSCHFFMHRSCYELPEEIEHPFHPKHPLTLKNLPYSFFCNACGKENYGFTFYCSECRFYLDIHCAALMPSKPNTEHEPIDHQHHLSSHSHQLILCNLEINDYDLFCSCCQLPIVKGVPIFVCLECRVLMDESCARLPPEIQHPFHKPHPLALSSVPQQSHDVCNACGLEPKGLIFRCSQCDFNLDVHCISLMPITNNNEHVISTHPHPLILHHKTKKYLPCYCSGCLLAFTEEDSIYVCLDCKMLLHYSCASLPLEMEHPFHPTHLLKLDNLRRPTRLCKACEKICQGFVYECYYCSFYLHVKCAFLVPRFINTEQHQHPLNFFDTKEASLFCNNCNKGCSYPFFRCVDCHFNLHAHCLSELPHSVKHRCHLHPLTLTTSPIKDYVDEDDDAEFYCDACEEYRKLHDPVYYCAECHYVAHVHCVISEIWPYLLKKSTLGDKLGNMKVDMSKDAIKDDTGDEEVEVPVLEIFISAGTRDDDQITTNANNSSEEFEINVVGDPVLVELDSEIATFEMGLNEIKSQLETLTRQLETQTIKLDKLKERRAQHLLSVQQ